MYAIDTLVAEHETILRMTRVMKRVALEIMDGGPVDAGDFARMISFIRLYADKGHHGKEEALLFREMQAHLGQTAQVLVRNGMLVEHDLGRLYVRQLEEAVAAHGQQGDAESRLAILTNAMAYVDLLQRHIERENGAVFPFAGRGLPPQVLEALDRETHSYEAAYAAERTRQLAALAALEDKYGR